MRRARCKEDNSTTRPRARGCLVDFPTKPQRDHVTVADVLSSRPHLLGHPTYTDYDLCDKTTSLLEVNIIM